MDAHSFTIAARELTALLQGARVEKIHGPAPGVFVFSLFARGRKVRLLLKSGRPSPLLFFTGAPPPNPARPPGPIMRLRKYCSGRRLGQTVIDAPTRAIAFMVVPQPDNPPVWLLLDLINGAHVCDTLPEGYGRRLHWPSAAEASAVVHELRVGKGTDPDGKEIWRRFDALTPLLRETLAALEPQEAKALLVDLEAGTEGLFAYRSRDGAALSYFAWPLPEVLCRQRGLEPASDIFPAGDTPQTGIILSPVTAQDRPVSALWPEFPSLALISLADEPRFTSAQGLAASKDAAKPVRRETKRRARLLAKLKSEEERLTGMLALRKDALALQGVLWQFPPDEKRETVSVQDAEAEGGERVLRLDPRLTVRANMARLFKESSRGARGLAMLAERRAILASEAGSAETSVDKEAVWTGPTNFKAIDATNSGQDVGEGRYGRPEEVAGEKEYKGVARFRSADGYTLFRGKNAAGNQILLKIGKGHDYWMHAEDGPSAHLVIRRSHAADEVPERTLMQAALLVGEKSWQKNADRAQIMLAEVRHVHPVKGGKPGAVKVDRIIRSIVVQLGVVSK